MLELEISETVAFQPRGRHRAAAEAARQGIKLAFDDFGTGYASLSYLTRFPVSRIKIDRGFVAKITDNAEDAAIVRSLIAMAHNLGLGIIAEGVETAEQARFLIDEQCEEAQGFLYAKPLCAADFQAYLTAHRLAEEAAAPSTGSTAWATPAAALALAVCVPTTAVGQGREARWPGVPCVGLRIHRRGMSCRSRSSISRKESPHRRDLVALNSTRAVCHRAIRRPSPLGPA